MTNDRILAARPTRLASSENELGSAWPSLPSDNDEIAHPINRISQNAKAPYLPNEGELGGVPLSPNSPNVIPNERIPNERIPNDRIPNDRIPVEGFNFVDQSPPDGMQNSVHSDIETEIPRSRQTKNVKKSSQRESLQMAHAPTQSYPSDQLVTRHHPSGSSSNQNHLSDQLVTRNYPSGQTPTRQMRTGQSLATAPEESEARRSEEISQRSAGEPMAISAENQRQFGKLAPLMLDPTIEEIWINSPNRIFVARNGKSHLTTLVMSTSEVRDLIERLLMWGGRRLDLSNPFVDARLPDGSRLHVAIPEITASHWAVNIRKHLMKGKSLRALTELGVMSNEVEEFLTRAVAQGLNILVSGSTQAGKTTLLNSLVGSLPTSSRVITIEEVFELRPNLPDCVGLQTRAANLQGDGEIPLRKLIKEALRMRPSHLIVGEIREAESLDLLIALNSGLPGMGTIHANSGRDALAKLQTLPLLAGSNISHHFIAPMVASCIDLVVHTSVIEGSISEQSSRPHAKVSADHFRTNDVQRRASLPMDEHSRQARLESRYRIENLHTTSNSDDAEWQGSTKNHEGSLGGSRRITEILHVTGRIENNRVESETVFSFDGTSYRRGLISPETIFESAAPFVKGGDE